jgi:hypothetical protein
MNVKKLLFNSLLFASLLSINSCKAPTGDLGPQGAAGAVGDKGDKGLTGDKGTFSGYASPWTSISDTQWKLTGLKAVVNQPDTKLTQAMLDQGLILAYYRRNAPFFDNTAVYPIPDELNEYLFTFKASVGSLDYELNFKKPEFVSTTFLEWQIQVRYIIVPAAKSGRLASINWRDYNEVKRILHLKD